MKRPRLHPIRRKLIATAIAAAGAMPNLTVAGICAAAMVFALAIATPAQAQITIQFGGQQVPGFSNNYPWFNDVPQYQGDQSFRYFLAYHPNIARALSRNPSLLCDANWRSQYPALEQYLENHPYEWQALNGEYWSEGPAQTQWGDYDNQRNWHDAYWWHQNNPSWCYDTHANWASLDSRWRDEDGAYDQQRQWHYGEWWYNQNPNWVTNNHPNWLREHQNWERPAEQQNYRQQHAMIQADQQQRDFQQQQATQHERNQLQNQQNQQRAIDQRQANLQQQQTMRLENQHQQQMNRQQNQQNQQRAIDQRQANLQQQQTMRQENLRQQQANHEAE